MCVWELTVLPKYSYYFLIHTAVCLFLQSSLTTVNTMQSSFSSYFDDHYISNWIKELSKWWEPSRWGEIKS